MPPSPTTGAPRVMPGYNAKMPACAQVGARGPHTTQTYGYMRRVLKVGVGTATSTYAYDWAGNRVSQTTGNTTTVYPTNLYSVMSTTVGSTTNATTTKFIFGGGTLLSTVDQAGTSTPVVHYVHSDQLGSPAAVTDASSTIVETLDYYPYGASKFDTMVGTYTGDPRKYIGQYSDTATGLDYLNSRYFDSSRGQFISQDPVFWEVGQTSDGKNVLANPQMMNSYSYAGDNPIINKDPTGRLFGIDDLAEIGLVELAVPIIRAGIVTGAVNTDFNIAVNIVQNASQGRLAYNATPGSLLNSLGQGAAFGATAETGAAFLTPFAKLALAAKNAKLASQVVSAAGVTAGADVYNGNTNPWQVGSDASIGALSTYAGARIVGMPRGSDVKSFSSPAFFGGANMSNTARQGVFSQSIQTFATAALTSIVAGLKNVVAALQAQQSQHK